MKKPMFKAAIAAAGITQRELAKRIGMSESTIITKVKNNGFSVSEAEDIALVLNLSKYELADIFFN